MYLQHFIKVQKNKGKKGDQMTLMGLGTLRTISIGCNVYEGRHCFVTILVLAFSPCQFLKSLLSQSFVTLQTIITKQGNSYACTSFHYHAPASQAPPKHPQETQFRKAHSLLNKQNSAPKTCENLSLSVLRQKPT